MLDPSTTSPAEAASIEVHGDVHGSIVYGDHNFVVNTNHGTIIYRGERPQVNRRAERPPAPRPPLLCLDRVDELKALQDALAAGVPAALYGIEGAGKSTLLRQVTSSLPGENLPDGVVLLNGPGISGVPQSLDDLAQSAFNALYESEPTLKVTAAEARTFLGNTKALFVLDGLALSPEMLDQLPDLMPTGSLLWAAPHPPRGETARIQPVAGLPRAEAIQLFLQTAEMEVTEEQRVTVDEICQAVEDMPLAILTLARWARGRKSVPGHVLRTLKGVAAKRETDPVRKAVGAVLVWLDALALRVFGLAATLNGPTVDRAALIEASGLDETKAAAALAVLEAHGILQAHSPDLGMPLVFKQHGRERYPASRDRSKLLNEIIVREAQKHAGDWDYLRANMGNLLGAFEALLAGGNLALAGEVARLLVPLLVLRGRWDLWHFVFQRLASQAADRALQAWGLHELGTRAFALGDPTGATRLLQEAIEIRRSLGDDEGLAYTRHNARQVAGVTPPPKPPPPRPPSGPSWLNTLFAAGLGGLGLLALVGVVVAAIYCTISGCGFGPPVPTPTPTARSETVLPGTTQAPTATLEPSITRTVQPSETPTVPPTRTEEATDTPTLTATPPLIVLELTPVGDAYVRAAGEAENYGGAPVLWVAGGSDVNRSFLLFDLSEIPANASVSEAHLRLWQITDLSEQAGDNQITVYAVDEAWDEAKITWNEAQSKFTGGYDTILVGREAGNYEWNVTELAQAWVSGKLPNFGLALVGEEGEVENYREFASREGFFEPTHPPVLLVSYEEQ